MNIIIAEDNEVLRDVLTDSLKKMGHSVTSAGSAAEFAEIALAGRPDLVITDLYMPGTYGEHITAMHPGLSGIPVIIFTGAARGELAAMDIPKEIPVFFKPLEFFRLFDEVKELSKKTAGKRKKDPGYFSELKLPEGTA